MSTLASPFHSALDAANLTEPGEITLTVNVFAPGSNVAPPVAPRETVIVPPAVQSDGIASRTLLTFSAPRPLSHQTSSFVESSPSTTSPFTRAVSVAPTSPSTASKRDTSNSTSVPAAA